MKQVVWLVVSGLLLSSCLTPVDTVGEGDDEGECDDGIDNDNDGYLDEQDAGCPEVDSMVTPNVIVMWDISALRIELSGLPSNSNYNLGIAETAGECLTDDSCWTGEDCFQGYDTDEMGNLLYCHPFYAGTSLELEYGALPERVDEGESTVFSASSDQSVVTYILNDLRSIADGSCWVWGSNTSYYEGFPKLCAEM